MNYSDFTSVGSSPVKPKYRVEMSIDGDKIFFSLNEYSVNIGIHKSLGKVEISISDLPSDIQALFAKYELLRQ